MRVWIIGKFGMVAEALSCCLQNMGICFCATSRKEVDICDIDAIRKWHNYFRPTHTINVAAYTAVDKAEEEIAKAYALAISSSALSTAVYAATLMVCVGRK